MKERPGNQPLLTFNSHDNQLCYYLNPDNFFKPQLTMQACSYVKVVTLKAP